jgi:hypothetical protein
MSYDEDYDDEQDESIHESDEEEDDLVSGESYTETGSEADDYDDKVNARFIYFMSIRRNYIQRFSSNNVH